MTAAEVQAIFDKVTSEYTNQAATQSKAIGDAQAAKGPSLKPIGGSGMGAYNYQRFVAPTVNTAVSGMTLQARQAALTQTIKEYQKQTSAAYDNARRAYTKRYNARLASQAAGGATTPTGVAPGTNTTTPTLKVETSVTKPVITGVDGAYTTFSDGSVAHFVPGAPDPSSGAATTNNAIYDRQQKLQQVQARLRATQGGAVGPYTNDQLISMWKPEDAFMLGF